MRVCLRFFCNRVDSQPLKKFVRSGRFVNNGVQRNVHFPKNLKRKQCIKFLLPGLF